MFRSTRKALMALGALGALALGGSTLANAASSGSSTTQQGTTTAQPPAGGQRPNGAPSGQRPDPTKPGGHVGANGKTEEALSSDVAAKVKAAAEAKVSGGTVERVETDVDFGSPYEAHVRKSDGSEVTVLVNKDFQVTAVKTQQHP